MTRISHLRPGESTVIKNEFQRQVVFASVLVKLRARLVVGVTASDAAREITNARSSEPRKRQSRIIVSYLIPIVLLGWIPISIVLLFVLPAQRAVVALIVGAAPFPPAAIPISGLPDYDKMMAATLGIMLGTLIFQPNRLLEFRPRLFDLPMVCWCLCPLISSLDNGLGLYDGLSAALGNTVRWGLPYLVGRLYFGDLQGFRDLTIGIVIGALAYVPPTAFEIRMSPMLRGMVYGMGGWGGLRFSGYRPYVFLANGLEHGMWMTIASLTAVWLWKCGALKRIGHCPWGASCSPSS